MLFARLHDAIDVANEIRVVHGLAIVHPEEPVAGFANGGGYVPLDSLPVVVTERLVLP